MSEAADYRHAQRALGRRMFLNFEMVNTLSFALLAGNIVILLLLRFEASRLLIGLVQAFPYAAFFFMPLAKRLVPRHGLVKTFGVAWTVRYLVIAPLVVAPLVAAAGHVSWGIALVVLGYLMFQITRGFGLVSISPLTQAIAAGKDRGAWLSQKNMIVYAASMISGLATSIALAGGAPLERYAILMGVGMVLGLAACTFIFRIPEPPGGKDAAATPFWADIREALSDPAYRRYFAAFSLFFFLSGLGRSFFVVYAQKASHFSSDAAMLLMVIAGFGPIIMGWFSRMALDRLGAKPLFISFHLIFLAASLALALIAPPQGMDAWLILSLVFTLGSFGGAGAENASQAYFMGLCKPRHQFNVGMFYYLVLGASGALGAFAGGALLQGLGSSVLGTGGNDWRVYWALVTVLGLVVLALQFRMVRNKDVTVVQAFGSMVSPRELKAMRLLRKLDESTNLAQEERTLSRLAGSRSHLVIDELLKRIGSPVFAIRNQALLGLGKLAGRKAVEDALIRHVAEHQFATAYRAARILGEHGSLRSAPVLRQALSSPDYLLQAYAASALADLGDLDAGPELEKLLLATANPLVMVHAIGALKRLGQVRSALAMLQVLGRDEQPPHMRDELVFGLAGLLGIEPWLYSKYLVFLEDQRRGVEILADELDAGGLRADLDPRLGALHRCVTEVLEPAGFAASVAGVLADAVELGFMDRDLAGALGACAESGPGGSYVRYRFFLAAVLVWANLFRQRLGQRGLAVQESEAPYTTPV